MSTETFERFLRLEAILNRTGLSRATIYRKMAEGSFPNRVRLSPRCNGWREAEVEKWLANPAAYRAHNEPAEPATRS